MPELATKADLLAMEQELRVSFSALETEFRARLEILTLRLTIRLGIMWAVAMWAVVIVVKLT
jgi:hypothetical protein